MTKLIIRIFNIGLISLILCSCGSNYIIYKTAPVRQLKEDSIKYLDNVKIVNVVDQRSVKDSVIGIAVKGMFDNEVPLIIDKPLPIYLKESFNSLINNNTTNSLGDLPVTVYVKEFYSGVQDLTFGKNLFSKYSYIFEYPVGKNKIRQVSIIDSIGMIVSSFANYRITKIINTGLRKTSKAFMSDYSEKVTDSLLLADNLNSINEGSPDNPKIIETKNIDMKEKSNILTKAGVQFCYYKGNRINPGIRAEYLRMSKRDSSRIELGIGYGVTYYNVLSTDKYSKGSFTSFSSGINMRYNVTKESNFLFVGGTLFLDAGIETTKSSNPDLHFFFGPTINEFIGLYLIKEVAVTAGLYQLYHLGSIFLKSDIGFNFSLSITGAY